MSLKGKCTFNMYKQCKIYNYLEKLNVDFVTRIRSLFSGWSQRSLTKKEAIHKYIIVHV